MVPNDATIKAFAKFLPTEAAHQEAVMQEEQGADEGEESYYDEEDDGEEAEEEDEEMAGAAATGQDSEANAEASTQAESQANEGGAQGGNGEEDKDSEESDEYDSDYDDEGRYIWGQEGEDWEFYYQEDKQAYERGESTVPEVMNPDALPRQGMVQVETTTATGTTD